MGISCNARHANTEIAVKWALESVAGLPGVETEYILLAGKTIYPCGNCYRCIGAESDDPCHGKHDDFKEICLKDMVIPSSRSSEWYSIYLEPKNDSLSVTD
jgi:multimeric flavodoxin WrbA